MILGMSTATYTAIHVLISLIAIGSGVLVMYGLFKSEQMGGGTAIFFVTTALTSITGFAFPFHGITPAIILGIISLAVLALVIPARYMFHFAGPWRAIYVVGACVALYFNVFVLVVQSFEKVPALHALAPTQKEPPFAIAQGTVLIIFTVLTIFATMRFHPKRGRTAAGGRI